MDVEGQCFWLSAGHIVEEIAELLDSPGTTVTALIADIFSPGGSTHAIPFVLNRNELAFIHDTELKLDFGLIPIRDNYLRMLRSNGTEVLTKKNWQSQHTIEFHSYSLLGIPAQLAGATDSGGFRLGLTLVPITNVELVDAEGEAAGYHRLRGRISADMGSLESIKGMSGGPLLGFNHSDPPRYWVVGIQSTWLPQSKTIFACPLPLIGELAGTVWRQISQRNEEPTLDS
ncbi:MAG: hypothetical protein JJ911_01360 [Rhizobiaceae bacterium]|nr:hypothetical protein [Rhizobiaceae bacterium]